MASADFDFAIELVVRFVLAQRFLRKVALSAQITAAFRRHCAVG
jgi:hypothetical protein